MNMIKYQYNDYEDDIVRVSEYMVLEESSNYLIMNVHNQFEENIKGIVIIVVQYDDNNQILSRSKVKHNDFICGSNSNFVPKSKVLLEENYASLDLYVSEAIFDNHYLVDGVINEINRDVIDIDDELNSSLEDNNTTVHETTGYLYFGSKLLIFFMMFLLITITMLLLFFFLEV